MSSIRMLDILGPIMIGPSSSHTAGACRLAYLAKTIYAKPFEKVVCELHGSFAETYAGHGTDRALAGGLLGFLPSCLMMNALKMPCPLLRSKILPFFLPQQILAQFTPIPFAFISLKQLILNIPSQLWVLQLEDQLLK